MIPATGFPWFADGDKAKEGKHAPTIRARCKHEHLIHHTCIRSRVDLAVIPLKRANETVRVRWDIVVLSVLGDRRGIYVLKALVGLDLV